METGVVSRVVADRGFGFISTPGRPDQFFHVSELQGGLEWSELLQGRRVEFEIATAPDGRTRAVKVRPAR